MITTAEDLDRRSGNVGPQPNLRIRALVASLYTDLREIALPVVRKYLARNISNRHARRKTTIQAPETQRKVGFIVRVTPGDTRIKSHRR